MHYFLRWILCFCALNASGALAYAAPKPEIRDRVIAVEPGQVLVLQTRGKAVLAGLIFPDAPRADGWLASHLLQKEIDIKPGEPDRYGRLAIDTDAQEEMLRSGVAVLFSARKPKKSLLDAEEEARSAQVGVWGKPGLVIPVSQAAGQLQQFRIMEGTITHIYAAKSATYLNFGADWHTDVSVTIPARSRRSFTRMLEEIGEGTRVRVRGVLYSENGPMMRVSRPEQIEILP